MLDLDAPILASESVGGVTLGTPIASLLADTAPVRVIELPPGEDGEVVTIHSFGAVRTWSVEGVVVQAGAFEGYRGRTPEGIGLGSTVAEIERAYGDVRPMGAEGMIEVPGCPGLGIETTAWNGVEPDPAARAIQLFVHAVDD